MKQPLQFGVRVLAIALLVVGTIWVLQGISVLPGRFMTGKIQWAYRGGIAVAVGVGLLLTAGRIRQ
jgi:hypothetical protein